MRSFGNFLKVAIFFAGVGSIANLPLAAADCGCGNASYSCGCRHHVCRKCCQTCDSEPTTKAARQRTATRDAGYSSLSVVPAMPMFMPMMMAPAAVVPASATTRAADYSAPEDCHARMTRLEKDLLDLTKAVSQLQGIVGDQTRAIEKVNANYEHLKSANNLK